MLSEGSSLFRGFSLQGLLEVHTKNVLSFRYPARLPVRPFNTAQDKEINKPLLQK